MHDHSFRFTRNEKIEIQPIFNHMSNTFTYEFWVKPEEKIHIVRQANVGATGTSAQRYVIVPGYSDNRNHAGIGVSIGTNGIAVFEHSRGHMPAVLVYEKSITDWTHVAVVYENRTPYLYLNGSFIKQGLISNKQLVFASGVFGRHDKYGQYKGMLREVRIWIMPGTISRF